MKKPLEKAKTWKELQDAAEDRGLKYLRTSGGHAIYGNEKGSMPFSTHEKEPSKNLLCKVRKQIIKLTEITAILIIVAVVVYNLV